MTDPEPTAWELAVRCFLYCHTEQLPGVRWVTDGRGERQLVLDDEAALSYAEFCLSLGAVRDEAAAAAGIAEWRKKLAAKRAKGSGS